MPIVPRSTPQQSRDATEAILRVHNITDDCVLVGVRGYYLNTMGEPGTNDRGVYDDAMIVVTPTAYVTFNANNDPSVFKRHTASLQPGVYQYQLGMHGLNRPKAKRYEALIQAGPVAIRRDEEGSERGWFGINIHRGGYHTTSSVGCQTIFPTQWPAFIALVKQELKRHRRKHVSYVLVENTLATPNSGSI